MTLLQFLAVGGITGFVIGWGTNWVVVESLFRPKRPMFGIALLHGVIPARRHDLIEKVCEVVQDRLMNADTLGRHIGTNIVDGDGVLSDFINDVAGQIITEKVSDVDVRGICRSQLEALDLDELERIIKSVVGKEFKFIIRFGGLLGFISGATAGLVQFLIIN